MNRRHFLGVSMAGGLVSPLVDSAVAGEESTDSNLFYCIVGDYEKNKREVWLEMLEATQNQRGPFCLVDGSFKELQTSKAAGQVVAYDLDFETADHHRCVMVTMHVIPPKGPEFIKLIEAGKRLYLTPAGKGFAPEDGSYGDTYFFSWFNMTTSSPFKCATTLDRKPLRSKKAG